MVTNGHEILKTKVNLIFENNAQTSLEDLIHSSIQAHAKGIKFRERNAGPKIDEHMKSEGFDVNIYLNGNTGFLHGGNQFNCGTWMDKMGSAPSNKGQPATPRDGAPIELTALLYSVVSFLGNLSS